MPKVEVSETIDRAIEEVWAYLTDLGDTGMVRLVARGRSPHPTGESRTVHSSAG